MESLSRQCRFPCIEFGVQAFVVGQGQAEAVNRLTARVGHAPVLTVDARVAWDNTAKQVNTPGVGRFPIGIATEAAGTGVTTVAVRLDDVATAAAQRPLNHQAW